VTPWVIFFFAVDLFSPDLAPSGIVRHKPLISFKFVRKISLVHAAALNGE
jgi:hypothetical protein